MHLNTFNLVVIGAGALGCAVLENVGKVDFSSVTVVDGDIVSKENLKNQTLYSAEDARQLKYKSDAAKSAMEKTNGRTKFVSGPFYVGESRIGGVVKNADLVIDTTDNVRTRLIINDACSKRKVPLLFASLRGNNGFCCVVDWKAACFNCIYRNSRPEDAEGCGTISAEAAATAGKLIFEKAVAFLGSKAGQNLFTSFSIDPFSISAVKINRDEKCEACSGRTYEHRLDNGFIQMCGGGIKFSLQMPIDLDRLVLSLEGAEPKDGGSAVFCRKGDKTLFISKFGDFLFTGYGKNEAKELIYGLFSSGALVS